ncbi:MAG: hypothetical protein HBSIN02_25080 [Bacteroidia bacterium]|nr:MAG: hypothetical protein HBSIN02_25080 [Bacteroidia bacterium]
MSVVYKVGLVPVYAYEILKATCHSRLLVRFHLWEIYEELRFDDGTSYAISMRALHVVANSFLWVII